MPSANDSPSFILYVFLILQFIGLLIVFLSVLVLLKSESRQIVVFRSFKATLTGPVVVLLIGVSFVWAPTLYKAWQADKQYQLVSEENKELLRQLKILGNELDKLRNVDVTADLSLVETATQEIPRLENARCRAIPVGVGESFDVQVGCGITSEQFQVVLKNVSATTYLHLELEDVSTSTRWRTVAPVKPLGPTYSLARIRQ